jgi:ABC-type transporter Mla maintaining outer membrane lipid asymmetry ATPase subunit MlaF
VPLVAIRSIVKHHGGLRPFRLRELSVEAGDVVGIGGPDEQSAAVFTDLLTGTTLPDEGEIVVAGRSTASLSTPDQWLAFLDCFGLVNARAVLLDRLTIAQNLAIARTLDVDPMSAETRDMAARMAAEVDLDPSALDDVLAAGPALTRLRIRLGRALAHNPSVLVIEHPSLGLERGEVADVARLIRRVGEGRRLASIVVSADPEVLRVSATRALTWRPATGELVRATRWSRWARR